MTKNILPTPPMLNINLSRSVCIQPIRSCLLQSIRLQCVEPVFDIATGATSTLALITPKSTNEIGKPETRPRKPLLCTFFWTCSSSTKGVPVTFASSELGATLPSQCFCAKCAKLFRFYSAPMCAHIFSSSHSSHTPQRKTQQKKKGC